MRTSLWTDDIADPSEITSYFAYSPNIQSMHSGWQDTAVDKLYEGRPEGGECRKARCMYKQIQKSYMDAAPIIFPLRIPISGGLSARTSRDSSRSPSVITSSPAPTSRSKLSSQPMAAARPDRSTDPDAPPPRCCLPRDVSARTH